MGNAIGDELTETSELFNRVMSQLAPGMTLLGFKQPRKNTFTLDVGAESAGFIEMFKATYPGEGFELNPMLGVRNLAVEAYVMRARGANSQSKWVPTVHTNIGYVAPGKAFKGWTFAVGEDTSYGVRNLLLDVKNVGLPFLHRHSSLDGVIDGLRSNYISSSMDRALRLSAAYALKGDGNRAVQKIDDHLTKLGDAQDAAADLFRAYAAGARSLIGA